MPIRKIEKPSKAEKDAATEAQAPSGQSKIRKPNPANIPNLTKPRSLKDAGIDGARHQFIKPAQLFEDDESLSSMAFIIHNARVYPNTLEPGKMNVHFTISLVGEEEKHVLSLAEDESRSAYVSYFATNTIPLGPIELVKLPATKKGFSDYLSLQDSEIPF